MRELLAIILATLSSVSYALSSALQAMEARTTPASEALRASLLARLVRRPMWLLGGATGVAGWVLQAGALALGSLALVQPALGLGLVVLLFFGSRLLHESIGPREIGGAIAISAAVVVLAWAAPAETGEFTSAGRVTAVIAIAVAAAAPTVLRLLGASSGLATSVCAGFGWACVGVSTALVDVALADGKLWVAALWGLGVVAASFATLVSEMSALQVWPATRAVPIAFGLEMALPAAAAPFLTAGDTQHAVAFVVALAVACGGAAVLGSSKVVAERAA
jgi:hypothetical protein